MLYLIDLFDTEHKLAPKDPAFRARFYKLMFYCRSNKCLHNKLLRPQIANKI